MPIFDNHGRPIEYVRLAVTDRCNLRCFYCMPAEGITYVARQSLLSYEEMERLLKIMASMGIRKVRITGGEPFVRRDLVPFLYRIHAIEGIEQVNLTTNGVLTGKYIPDLVQMGLHSVNLSCDTLNRERFFKITRRDELPKVRACLDQLLESGIKTKINAVVMAGKNTEDLLDLVEYTRHHPVTVRFIEEMPFNGTGDHYAKLEWNHKKILSHIREHHPRIMALPFENGATAINYQIPGFKGKVGIIAAFTRTFCGSCNRIRMTATGTLKTCLYDDGVLDLRTLLRDGSDDTAIELALKRAFGSRAKDGYEAEKARKSKGKVSESMSTIGG
ncbi:MAG: GTP 3',8-cyclase MoaA [Bacteroidota bacterium]